MGYNYYHIENLTQICSFCHKRDHFVGSYVTSGLYSSRISNLESVC